MDIKTKVKEKFKNKKFKIATIVVVCLVVLGGISYTVYNYDSLFLSNDEKTKIIVNTYIEKGKQSADKKCEELFKFNSRTCKAAKQVVLQEDNQRKALRQKSVGIQKKDRININDFMISDIKANRDENNEYIYVTGNIKNNGKTPTRYYEIYVDFYDNNGNVIETDRTNSTIALQSNASNTFKVMAHCQDGIKDCKAYVHEVR